MNIIRKHFESTASYADWAEQTLDPNSIKSSWSRNRGLHNAIEGIAYLRTGYNKYNDEIERIQQEIWENIPTLKRYWKNSVQGYFPNVPAFLRGEHENMFTIDQEQNEHTPIRIYIGLSVSWMFTEQDIAKRGAAIAAFASALSEIRPVYITPYVLNSQKLGYRYGDGDSAQEFAILSWDIASSPLVISNLAAAMCCEKVTRYLGLEASYYLNPKVGEGLPEIQGDPKKTQAAFNLGPDDIFLNGLTYGDALMKDPIGWVKNQLKKYTTEEE